MRVHQSYLVICLVAVVAAVGIGVVAFRSADSHRNIMLGALQRGLERAYDEAISATRSLGRDHRERKRLERAYDEAISATAPRETQQELLLTSEALRRVLLDGQKPRDILPGFVDSKDVYLPRGSVSIPSDQLICVVRLGDARLYGITGKRIWREVSLGEFEGWPHESLATNAPAMQ